MKAYVIRLKDIEVSEDLANECVKSGEDFDLAIERFDGVYGEKAIEKAHNLFNIKPINPKMKKNRIGVKGCFLSHFSLWSICESTDKPIIVFEHDAMLLEKIPENICDQFEDVLLLDPFNKFSKSYNTCHERNKNKDQLIVEYINPEPKLKYGLKFEYPMGLQAYIIKPEAATKLIHDVRKNGYLPADMQCNKGLINLSTVERPLASINKKFYHDKVLMNQLSTTQKNGYVDGIS